MPDGPAHGEPDPATPVAAVARWGAAAARWLSSPLAWISVVLAAGTSLLSCSDRGRLGQRDFQCMSNLMQLAEICVAEEAIGPRRSQRTGPALLLEWRKSGRLSPWHESLLVCPRDPGALVTGEIASGCPNDPVGEPRAAPVARSPWDDADLDDPAPGLCSYAVRDFARYPLAKGVTEPRVVAACFHHPRRAIVAFSDGTARFVRLDELGLDDESELTAGSDSKVPLFRELLAPPARHEK